MAGRNAQSENPIYRYWRNDVAASKADLNPEEFREQLSAIDASIKLHRSLQQLKNNLVMGQQSMLNTCLVALGWTTDRLAALDDRRIDMQAVENALREQVSLLGFLREARDDASKLLKEGGLEHLVHVPGQT